MTDMAAEAYHLEKERRRRIREKKICIFCNHSRDASYLREFEVNCTWPKKIGIIGEPTKMINDFCDNWEPIK